MKKDFMMGGILGILIGGATMAFAVGNHVEVLLNQDIKVSLNGVIQEFRDESTNEVQYPLTYLGRTYLPLRTVANLVDVSVDYDPNTNTALLYTSDYEKPEKEVVMNPIVTMEIENYGTIKMELYPEVAPNTVNNFIDLVSNGFYNGLTFHRTIPDFVIQGGDPDGDGTGGANYTIIGEFASNGVENNLKHERGVLSMARATDPNSASSQFFIVTKDANYLDGSYAAFGRVFEGMDVVDAIVNCEVVRRYVDEGVNYFTDSEEYIKQMLEVDRPVQPPVIKNATVETFGVQYAEPVKVAN